MVPEISKPHSALSGQNSRVFSSDSTSPAERVVEGREVGVRDGRWEEGEDRGGGLEQRGEWSQRKKRASFGQVMLNEM